MEDVEQVDRYWKRNHHCSSNHSPPSSPAPFDNNLLPTASTDDDSADSCGISSGGGVGERGGGGGGNDDVLLLVDGNNKQNGQMNMDDMGPETDVDSLDDVLLSPSIAAAKALANAEQPNVKQQSGEELKSDVGVNDIESGEDSEEEWNYISGKESGNKEIPVISVQQIQQGLNAENEEDDMESQLNPNAAEFVPVFIPSSVGVSLEKDISSSPLKGSEQNLENIFIPSVKEFYSEISKRPSDLESLDHDKSLNESTLNGVDLTGISTKAVYGGDDSNFLSSVNNSVIASTIGDDEDEAIEVAGNLCDTNPFSPTHIATTEPFVEKSLQKTDVIQEQMVQDHFSLGLKQFDPMTQSVTMMEDEGQHEDETSPDLDFMSSGKPDLLTPDANQEVPPGIALGNEAHEGHTSSSGFDSESGPDDGDQIPAEQCTAATVGINFGEDVNLQGIVNTKSMSLIDDSHPIEKIEQSLSPSISPMPQATVMKEEETKIEIVTEEEKSDIIQFETTPKIDKEFMVTGMSPPQLIDLVQKLQFTQEEPQANFKNKDEEPESDSGFEIIQASEASNEINVTEEEVLVNKIQIDNVELSAVSNVAPLPSVPDILQTPEISGDRLASPVGTGTENIIADIEGAMLDSTSPTTGHALNEKFIKLEEEALIKLPDISTFNTDKLEEDSKKNNVEEIVRKGNDHLFDIKKEEIIPKGIGIEKGMNDIESDKVEEEVREVIQDALCTIGENKKEEICLSPTKLINDEAKTLVVKEEISNFTIKCEEISKIPEQQLIQISVDKKETEEQLVHLEEVNVNELLDKPSLIEAEASIIKKEPTAEKEKKVDEEIREQILSLDEVKTNLEEAVPTQPTPPTTPAPGVTEEGDKQELIAAALAAAGVAAGAGAAAVLTSSSETPKVEEKVEPSPLKKPGVGTTVTSKKPEPSKSLTSTTKSATGTSTKSPAKPGVAASAATKKPTSVAGTTTKSTISKTNATATKQTTSTASKPSTPTSKVAATARPSSAKLNATTKTSASTAPAKTLAKPRTPTSAKPPITASTTPKGPTGTTTARTSLTKTTSLPTGPKPSTATTATKKPEPATATKKPLTSTAARPPLTSTTSKTTVSKTNSSSAAATKSSTTTNKPASSIASKTLASKPTSTSTTTKTSTTSIKPPVKTTSGAAAAKTMNSLASTKTTLTKTAPTKTSAANNNSTATKTTLPTKTKPAAPTAIKKPLSSDKNIKDNSNNKLSTVKQAGAIKKNEINNKTIPIETKLIEPLTQEPTVTTTNGHIENGISNESSSPIEVELN